MRTQFSELRGASNEARLGTLFNLFRLEALVHQVGFYRPTTTGQSGDFKFSLIFISHTRAQAKVRHFEDSSFTITAPPGVFKLAPMRGIAESITVALSSAAGVAPSEFEIESGLSVDSKRICQAFAKVTSDMVIEPSLVHATVRLYFAALTGKTETGSTSQSLLEGEIELEDALRGTILDLAHARLIDVGGSVVNHPLTAHFNGTPFSSLEGQFAPRPVGKIDKQVILDRLVFNGYEKDVRMVSFILPDGSKLRAHWRNHSDFAGVRALSISDHDARTFKFHVTCDQAGRPVHTVLLD
jgi:hypothetical protein